MKKLMDRTMRSVILSMVIAFVCKCVLAAEIGDITYEYDRELWSTTDRTTVDDVEYLYTYKGVQHYVQVVTEIVSENEIHTEDRESGSVTTKFVIEKATPLTGNYEIKIDLGDILRSFSPDYYSYSWWDDNGYHSTLYYYQNVDTIVIGDSCFEGNELVESVAIYYSLWDATGRTHEFNKSLEISNRSFYGAKNLRYVATREPYSASEELKKAFNSLKLTKIGPSAFVGCETLVCVAANCDELTTIDEYAFSGCENLHGIATEYDYVGDVIDGWISQGHHYIWDTPKLSSIGEYAFQGVSPEGGFYDYTENAHCGVMEWTFSNSDIRIGEHAFENCGLFKSIALPSDMTILPSGIFDGLNGANWWRSTQLELPETLVKIESRALAASHVIIKQWPSNLKIIEANAFNYFRANVGYSINADRTQMLRSLSGPWLSLPMSVTKIGEYAFAAYIANGGCQPVWKDGKIDYLGADSSAICVCGPLSGTIEFPQAIDLVPTGCFYGNSLLECVTLHSGVTSIGAYAFQACSSLKLTIPATVLQIGIDAGSAAYVYTSRGQLDTVPGVKEVIFEGKPPKGVSKSGFLNCSQVLVPAEFATEWAPYMNENVKLAKKVDGVWTALGGSVVSAKIRDGVPNVMDITYKVTSIKPSVKVRLVAYKDGSKSFANATVPVTFVADKDGNATSGNIGDAVEPNVEHTVSWQVSSDWGDVKLAKISVEVFVLDDELLPLQLMSLPANETRGKLTFSHNTQSSEKVSNALYWLLASKESDLKLDSGKLTRTDTNAELANGTSINTSNALAYLYGKMGYGVLTGDNLSEVNSTVRLSLGDKTYAAKVETK